MPIVLRLSLLIVCAWPAWPGQAKTLNLPPIVVQGGNQRHRETRPAEWTVEYEQPKETIQLPQLDEALNSIGGVQARTQGSPTIAIRGSAQSGRVLSLFNNIPLNFASSFGASPLFIPKETIGELAIIRGPASQFYGSQAMSGAINFFPRKFLRPEFALNISDTNNSAITGKEGGVQHQSWFFATPIVNSKKNFLQGSLFYEDDDGRFPFRSSSGSGVREFNAQNLGRATFNGTSKLENVHLSYDLIVGRQIRQVPGATNLPFPTRLETEGLLASITPHYFISDQHSVKTRLSYLETRSDFLASGVPTFSNNQTMILQNEWISDFSRTTKLQVFFDGFLHQLDDSFAGENLTQEQFELGPFLTLYSLPWLKHQMGGRFVSAGSLFLPSASTHILWDNSDFWLSVAEGFRNPTLNDKFSSDPSFIGNENLMAERSVQWELGFSQVFSSATREWSWDARLFTMEYSNFFETLQVSPGVFTKINSGDGISRGFDLGGRYSDGPFNISVDYLWLTTENRAQQRAFRLSPEHQLTIDSSYQLGPWGLQVQNIHWYNAIDVANNQAVDLPDWQQWNFFVHRSFGQSNRLSFGVINAFDVEKQLTLFYPEPQRKFWFQYRQVF